MSKRYCGGAEEIDALVDPPAKLRRPPLWYLAQDREPRPHILAPPMIMVAPQVDFADAWATAQVTARDNKQPPTGFAVGPVAGLVGIEGGVVSGVFNLESPGLRAPGRRPRHDQRYHEA
jgi:hypothetical protein